MYLQPVMIQLKKLTSFDNQHRSTGPFDSDCTEAFASLFQRQTTDILRNSIL